MTNSNEVPRAGLLHLVPTKSYAVFFLGGGGGWWVESKMEMGHLEVWEPLSLSCFHGKV